MEANIPIKKALSYGIDEFKKRAGYLISVLLVYHIIILGLGWGLKLFDGLTHSILYLVTQVISVILMLGLIYIALAIYNKKETTINDLFRQTEQLGQAIILYIIISLIIIGGFILLIVPGIIWGIKYSQAFYLLVDKKLDWKEALTKSGEITMNKKWGLLGYYIIMTLVNVLGMLAFGVGLLVSIPVTMLASVFIYKHLVGNVTTESGAPAIEGTVK
ncbi:MAG: hypothetical protein HOE80_04525 [Candidatus Magasanikbacteria bacterium]|jgi:uncharacterized membrane protein|nr:hypothetical protein [Candidatus Magasanikbacteria bacterium]MBT4071958.1 hypothetical protein [Candidatus Magasanikbacteria bacterium]